MAIIGQKVRFVHVPSGTSLPASRDANTVYFDSNSKAIYVGMEKVGDVAPEIDISAYLEPYEVKSVDIVGDGTFIAGAQFNPTSGVLTLTRETPPDTQIARGVDPEPTSVVLNYSDEFVAVRDVSVADNTIYTNKARYRLPDADALLASGKFATAEQGQRADEAMPATSGTANSATVYLRADPVENLEAATKQYVDALREKLTGAMHLLGTSTTKITDGGREHPKIKGKVLDTETLNPGDVVRYSPDPDGQYIEFVWVEDDEGTGSWELLGSSSSYVLKDTKILAGEGISVEGASLAEDVTVSHGAIGEGAESYCTPTPDKIMLPSSVVRDKFGHFIALRCNYDATDVVANIAASAVQNDINQIKADYQKKLVAGDNIALTPQPDGTVKISSSGGSSVSTKEEILAALGYEEVQIQYTDANGVVTPMTVLAKA